VAGCRAGAAGGQIADHRILWRERAVSESPWTSAFVQRLRQLGGIEGRTIAIEYRWAEGRAGPRR
jgi:hypothetical protein